MFKIIKKNLFLLSIFINILNSGLNENNENRKLNPNPLKRRNPFIDPYRNVYEQNSLKKTSFDKNNGDEFNKIINKFKNLKISDPDKFNEKPPFKLSIDSAIKMYLLLEDNDKEFNNSQINYIQGLMKTPKKKNKFLD